MALIYLEKHSKAFTLIYFENTQKIDRTMLAGISSSCFCSWKFEGLNLPKEAQSQVWDGDLIYEIIKVIYLCILFIPSAFFYIFGCTKKHICMTKWLLPTGLFKFKNVTRFFVLLLAITVDISLVRRLPVRSACVLPPVSLLTWEMSTIGPPKFQTNLVYIWI